MRYVFRFKHESRSALVAANPLTRTMSITIGLRVLKRKRYVSKKPNEILMSISKSLHPQTNISFT